MFKNMEEDARDDEIVKQEMFEIEQGLKKSQEKRKKKTKDEDVDEDVIEEPNPHETPQKEILWATSKGMLETMKQLLNADPSLVSAEDNDGYTPLHRACYNNHPEIVELLLQHGASVGAITADHWTPLHSAAKWNNIQCALKLLQHGANVNARTDSGQSPLHLAATHPESKELLLLLLNNPSMEVDLKNTNNETAKDLAHRSCKYYKLFEISDQNLNWI